MIKDITWFKEEIEPSLKNYEIKYKYFENGDFGNLNQAEFNSDEKGGVIDFWSSGWLAIHLVDYIKEVELMNVFLEPKELIEKENAFEQLRKLLS